MVEVELFDRRLRSELRLLRPRRRVCSIRLVLSNLHREGSEDPRDRECWVRIGCGVERGIDRFERGRERPWISADGDGSRSGRRRFRRLRLR